MLVSIKTFLNIETIKIACKKKYSKTHKKYPGNITNFAFCLSWKFFI
jgi:hypothetical protein